jgi:hypothetical protein
MDLREAIARYNDHSLTRGTMPEEIIRVLSENHALVEYQGDDFLLFAGPEIVRLIDTGEDAVPSTNEETRGEAS